MRVTINRTQARRDSRLTGIRLSLLTLRLMEHWRRNVPDYDSAMIAVAVVAITAERWTRAELDPELRDIRRPIPADRLSPCNVASLAAATGLNRETARRKVKALIDQGILARGEGGAIAFAPGHVQKEATVELVEKQLEAFTRTVDELLRSDVLSLAG